MIFGYRPIAGLGLDLQGDASPGARESLDTDMTDAGVVTVRAGAQEYKTRWLSGQANAIAWTGAENGPHEAVWFRGDDTAYAVKSRELFVLADTIGENAWINTGSGGYPYRAREYVVAPNPLGNDAETAVLVSEYGRYAMVVVGGEIQIFRWSLDGTFTQWRSFLNAGQVGPPVIIPSIDQPQIGAADDQSGFVYVYSAVDATAGTLQIRASPWRVTDPTSFDPIGFVVHEFTPAPNTPNVFSVSRHPTEADSVLITAVDLDSGLPVILYTRVSTDGIVASESAQTIPLPPSSIHTTVYPNVAVHTAYCDGITLGLTRLNAAFSQTDANETITTPAVRVSAVILDPIVNPRVSNLTVEIDTGDVNLPWCGQYQALAAGAILPVLDENGEHVRQLRATLVGHTAPLRRFTGTPEPVSNPVAMSMQRPVGYGQSFDTLTPGTLDLGPVLGIDVGRGMRLADGVLVDSPNATRYCARFASLAAFISRNESDLVVPQPRNYSVTPDGFVAAYVFDDLDDNQDRVIKLCLVDAAPRGEVPALIGSQSYVTRAGFPVVTTTYGQHEADWHVYPGFGMQAISSTANLLNGVYGIAVTYAHITENGELWRSAPTFGQLTIAAPLDTPQITVFYNQFTERPTDQPDGLDYTLPNRGAAPVFLEFWRTLRNQSAPYYRLDESAVLANTQNVRGDLSNVTLVKTLLATDADIVADPNREILDQAPPGLGLLGVLEHRRSRVTDFLVAANERLFAPDPLRSDIVRFTIARRDGFGVGWADTQLLQTSISSPGRIIAGSELDTRFVFLDTNYATAITGIGPDPTGSGPAFSAPQPVRLLDGPRDHTLLTRIPQGIAYVATESLQLLDRALQSNDITGTLSRYFRYDAPDLRALVYHPVDRDLIVISADQNTVRLQVGTGRWSRDNTSRLGVAGAVSSAGIVALMRVDGGVLHFDDTERSDGAEAITWVFETPTLRPEPALLSKAYDLQRIFIHVNGIDEDGIASSLNVEVIDAVTGALLGPTRNFTVPVGPHSLAIGAVRARVSGHRVRLTRITGTVPFAVVGIDSQVSFPSAIIVQLPNDQEL